MMKILFELRQIDWVLRSEQSYLNNKVIIGTLLPLYHAL